MSIGPSSDPNITAFFSSSDVEKAAAINTALLSGRLSFVSAIIHRSECDETTRRLVVKGCIDNDCSAVLATEEIRKKIFGDHYEEKKEAIYAALKKGDVDLFKELIKADVDGIELAAKDQEEIIKMAIEAYKKGMQAFEKGLFPGSLNRILEIIVILFDKGSLSEETRLSIISLAIKANYLELLEYLVSNPSAIDAREQALIEAIKLDRLDLVEPLLKSGVISEKGTNKAFETAASKGHLPTIEKFLETGAISGKTIHSAVVIAAGEGHLAVIKKLLDILLEDDPSISDMRKSAIKRALIGKLVGVAARGGHLEVIEALLADATISEEDRAKAVLNAEYGGHLEVVEALLAGHEKVRGEAVVAAAREGRLKLVQALLADGTTISKEDRGRAVVAAAREGRLAVIETLLAGGATISEYNQGEAVKWAAYGGHLAVIERLLLDCVDYEKLRSLALAAAATEGHLAVVQALLAGARISEACRGQAVVAAALGGHLAVIQTLLPNDATIVEADRGRAVMNAAAGGHLAIIERLLANHAKILKIDREESIIYATEDGHSAVIERLLVDHEDLRGYAVEVAARSGKLSIIEALLGSGATISAEDRGKAIVAAANAGHVAVVQALLAGGATIPEDLRAPVVTWAALNGHLPIIQAVLGHGPIPEEHRLQAIENAQAMGHLAIVAILGGNQNAGMLDVHAGDRDEKTKNSIINFYAYQGPVTKDDIDKAYQAFCTYLQTPGATDQETLSKAKAFHALVGAKLAGEGFGPFIQEGSPSTIKGYPVDTKEFIARLWIFVNHLTDEKDKSLAILGIISAFEDSVLANNHRVCNVGKIQRLVLAVLQGRVPGVNVDEVPFEVEIEKMSLKEAQNLFGESITDMTCTKKLSTFLQAAHKFCEGSTRINEKELLTYLANEAFEEDAVVVQELDISKADLDAFIEDLMKKH